MGKGIWAIDASIAFIIILVLAQLCLVWESAVIDSTVSLHSSAEKQRELIAASDRLINDPKCLAKTDEVRVIPQTIDSRKLETAKKCYGNFELNGNRGIKRLVFLDKEGGDVVVLSVW